MTDPDDKFTRPLEPWQRDEGLARDSRDNFIKMLESLRKVSRMPQPGDYCCVQIPWIRKMLFGRSWVLPNVVGYAIRFFTHSRFDHAFLYVGPAFSADGKTPMIVEAQPNGACLSPLSKYDGKLKVWSTDALTIEERQEIVATAVARIGTPYGFLDIVYLGLANLGFKWNWLLDRVEDQRTLICSQLCAVCGVSAGVTAWLCGLPNACLVTPGDLARRVRTKIRR